jgi:hypothetical protein
MASSFVVYRHDEKTVGTYTEESTHLFFCDNDCGNAVEDKSSTDYCSSCAYSVDDYECPGCGRSRIDSSVNNGYCGACWHQYYGFQDDPWEEACDECGKPCSNGRLTCLCPYDADDIRKMDIQLSRGM